jgi:putative colanic acid biosynthesis UDP-glucose lipid carrier transferase
MQPVAAEDLVAAGANWPGPTAQDWALGSADSVPLAPALAGAPRSPVRHSAAQRTGKHALDLALAALLLLLLAPFLAALTLAVRLASPGPALFRQRRIGLDGVPFDIFKFRTMVLHAEPAGSLTQAIPGDPRVTRLGAFLRRTSLDELPQLLNVLRGEMSLVGPRPHAVFHHEQYRRLIQAYMERHRMKPGITGWAQVNGWRGPTDTLEKMQKRIEFDLHYIERWSLRLDLLILWLTLWRGFFHPNAC